jgi:hypothetical protein
LKEGKLPLYPRRPRLISGTARLRVVILFALSAAIGAGGAAGTHGDFGLSVRWIELGLASTVLCLLAGAIASLFRRTRPYGYGSLALQAGCGLILSLAFFLIFSRAIIAVDLWRAKRFVARTLSPELERQHRRDGVYPVRWQLWESPPPGSPWLVRRFQYASNGQRYSLSVMDPGACGRVATYESATGRWKDSYEPCWY